MATSIDRLLAKKGWTGEEVGKALIASLLNDIANRGKPDYKPLFSQADFKKMESSLKRDRDFLAYGVYRDIYSAIIETHNQGQGLYQQFCNGFYRYVIYLRGAQQADEVLADMEKRPLIMSEKQYKQAEAETIAWQRGFKTSFNSILFTLLSSYLTALDKGRADKVPPSILHAIEATKEEPAENKRLLLLYWDDLEHGYYTLPDGRRSDSMTEEEWEKANEELFLKDHEFTIDGSPASPEEILYSYKVGRMCRGHELFYKGEAAIREAYKESTGKELEGDAAEILKDLESIIKDTGSSKYSTLREDLYSFYMEETPKEWHDYEEPPEELEELTKYDILNAYLDNYSGYDEDIPAEEQLKEFKEDYPALYKALDAHIRETVPAAKNLKPSQLYKDLLGWGELIDSGILGPGAGSSASSFDIISYLQAERDYKFMDSQRAKMRGIAVLQNPRGYQLTRDGDYKEDINPLIGLENIDFIAESEDTREEIKSFRNILFIPALASIYAFNALLLLIGEVYDIDGIEAAQINTSRFEIQLGALNQAQHSFYFNVYGDEEEKSRKRALIKEIFQPVDFEALKPKEDDIKAVREELSKAGISTTARKLLKDTRGLTDKLTIREEAY